jgi:hypothetical protein
VPLPDSRRSKNSARPRSTAPQHIDITRHLCRGFCPLRPLVEKHPGRVPVEIPNCQIKTVTQQTAGKFATDVTESDKSYFHALISLCP